MIVLPREMNQLHRVPFFKCLLYSVQLFFLVRRLLWKLNAVHRWMVCVGFYEAISGLHVINLSSHAIFHSFHRCARCVISIMWAPSKWRTHNFYNFSKHRHLGFVARSNWVYCSSLREQLISFCAKWTKWNEVRHRRAIFTLTIVVETSGLAVECTTMYVIVKVWLIFAWSFDFNDFIGRRFKQPMPFLRQWKWNSIRINVSIFLTNSISKRQQQNSLSQPERALRTFIHSRKTKWKKRANKIFAVKVMNTR